MSGDPINLTKTAPALRLGEPFVICEGPIAEHLVIGETFALTGSARPDVWLRTVHHHENGAWSCIVVDEPPAPHFRSDVLPKAEDRKPPARPSGGACSMCGGMLIRTGKCETCQSCGTTTGCG